MMKKITSFILSSLVAFTFAGCSSIHVSLGSEEKTVTQEQNVENKPVSSGNTTAQGEVKQDQNKGDTPTVNVNINGVPQNNNVSDVVVIEQPSNKPAYYGGFIFWNSDHVYLTESQVSSLTDFELGVARNEIYARHGYIFSTERWRTYFMAQSWYTPITKNVTLNSIETYNVSLIKAEEDRRGVKN